MKKQIQWDIACLDQGRLRTSWTNPVLGTSFKLFIHISNIAGWVVCRFCWNSCICHVNSSKLDLAQLDSALLQGCAHQFPSLWKIHCGKGRVEMVSKGHQNISKLHQKSIILCGRWLWKLHTQTHLGCLQGARTEKEKYEMIGKRTVLGRCYFFNVRKIRWKLFETCFNLQLSFDQERVNPARRAVCRALSGRKQREDSKIRKVRWMRARKAASDWYIGYTSTIS